MAKEDKKNLKRLQEIIKVLSKYEFGYLIEKIKLKHKSHSLAHPMIMKHWKN